jgi:DNA-binding IclR family transcriptional regulator
MSNVQSVERAFSILQTIGQNPDGIGAAEIAQAIDLPRPTVIRLLNTMQAVDAVERLPDETTYRIGDGILALSASQPFSRRLVMIVRPFLQQIADQTKETVYLSIPDGNQTHYIDQIDSQYHIQGSNWIDTKVPLHIVADGKLFLSTWDDVALNQYFNDTFEPYASNAIQTLPQLQAQLQAISQSGLAFTRNEFEEGLVACAAPIKNQNGQIVAALTIGGPAYRLTEENTKQFAQLLKETAEVISKKL